MLKRTVSLRRFLWVPQHMFWLRNTYYSSYLEAWLVCICNTLWCYRWGRESLLLCCRVAVTVLWLFLAEPWFYLWFVSVAFSWSYSLVFCCCFFFCFFFGGGGVEKVGVNVIKATSKNTLFVLHSHGQWIYLSWSWKVFLSLISSAIISEFWGNKQFLFLAFF